MTKKIKDPIIETPIEEFKVPSFYEENNKSTKYQWNEDFIIKVSSRLYQWFSQNPHRYFYNDFPAENMGVTWNFFYKKVIEYPLIWKNIETDLKRITTNRIATSAINGKANSQAALKALRHIGEIWSDESTINVNTKSISDQIKEAHDKLNLKSKDINNEPEKEVRDWDLEIIPAYIPKIRVLKSQEVKDLEEESQIIKD